MSYSSRPRFRSRSRSRYPRCFLLVVFITLCLSSTRPVSANEEGHELPVAVAQPATHEDHVAKELADSIPQNVSDEHDPAVGADSHLEHQLPPDVVGGHDNGETTPVKHDKVARIYADDSSVRVDDESIAKVNDERTVLAKKLADIESLHNRMASKQNLLRRVQALQRRVDITTVDDQKIRDDESQAEEAFKLSSLKLNATLDERDAIARDRLRVEKLLGELKTEKGNFEAEYSKMEVQRKDNNEREVQLKLEHDQLTKHLTEVLDKFRDGGFQIWLSKNLHVLSPVIRETILKTSLAIDPMLQGVEGASQLNELLTNGTTEAITRFMPSLRESPFYTGLIFYIILLCPTVVAMWLVMKVRARLSLLTVEHYLIAINLYFGVMSTVCAVMSIVGGSDVLLLLRHRSHQIAEPFMLVHGLLFAIHLVLHGMTAFVSGSRKDFAQYVGISCVGLHFFMHAYKRTILNQDPNIGAPAYIVYAIIFLYMLYDRGLHIIEAILHGRKAGARAFGTFPTDLDAKGHGTLPATRQQNKGDTTVYFAGLPVFNAPSQSSLNDAKTI